MLPTHHQLSADLACTLAKICWLTVGRLSADKRPTVGLGSCSSQLPVFFTFKLPLQAENNVNLAENLRKTKQESRKCHVINGQQFRLHVRLHDVYIASLLSAAYYKTFSFYFKFSGEPCLPCNFRTQSVCKSMVQHCKYNFRLLAQLLNGWITLSTR